MVISYIRIYYSVYFSYNICLEILINLRIYLVFMRISLCILWNPWISVVNLQYSALNPQNCHFSNLFLSPLLLYLVGSRLWEECHCKNCQFRSLLNSKLVNYSIFCNIYSEILHVFRISCNILSDFTPNIVKSMDLNKSSIFFVILIVNLSPWILCTSRLILTSGVKRREVSVFCF